VIEGQGKLGDVRTMLVRWCKDKVSYVIEGQGKLGDVRTMLVRW